MACGRSPPATAQAITEGCRRTGALLIADEIQSGSGRTGAFLRSGAVGLTPDLVSLGKALGAGMPVGAALLNSKVAASISAGDHGTTYGGNLLACRAALTFLDVLDEAMLASIRRVGDYLFGHLRELAAAYPALVAEVRGAGLIAGLDLARRCDAGGAGRARTWPHHQPHVGHGRPPAAAVHHHRAATLTKAWRS